MVGAAVVVVVEEIVEYPGIRCWGDVMTAASSVIATFVPKLHAKFACNGSDYGGGADGGGSGGCGQRGGASRERFVPSGDRVVDWGAKSCSMVFPPQADFPSTRGQR